MSQNKFERIGLVGALPQDSQRTYPLGYKMQSHWARPNVTDKSLRKVSGNRMRSIDLGAKRIAKAIELGLLNVIQHDGKIVILEKRQRVGKYFSAHGGKIEPSNATVIRNTRVKQAPKNAAIAKFLSEITPKNRDEVVQKVNAITYTSKGYGAIRIRDPKTGDVVKMGKVNLPHSFR